MDTIFSLNDIDNPDTKYITEDLFYGYPTKPIVEAEKKLLSDEYSIAYLSMEYGLAPSVYHSFNVDYKLPEENMFRQHEIFSNLRGLDYFINIKVDKMLDLPIYSGGLGVLAGDTLKSMADLGMSVVAIGILWNKGYFKQNFWFRYGQLPEELHWDPWHYPGLVPLNKKVVIQLGKDTLHLKLWKYYVYSYDNRFVVPLVLLDADIEENPDYLRRLTDQLYRSDNAWWKICQRAILGLGGVEALKALGYKVNKYHLNEGHAAFAILKRALEGGGQSVDELKSTFVYTCHTPVAAGHDRFTVSDLNNVFLPEEVAFLQRFGTEGDNHNVVNLTLFAMNLSEKINAVAYKHSLVMHNQFPAYKDRIFAVTNGVHLHTWISTPFKQLLDKYRPQIGDWDRDPQLLKNVLQLKDNPDFRKDIWDAHQANKRRLIELVWRWQVEENVFTFAWARRIAAYKRPSLIFRNVERLIDIAKRKGKIQFIFAGKAHPNDNLGFTFINEIMNTIDSLYDAKDYIRVLMLENYDTFFGKVLTNSVDVWLNNPLPPFEASGTSGMKAILNGVLQLTTLDGWVVEAENNDLGWIFGYRDEKNDASNELNLRLDDDANALYDTLEKVIDLYYATNKNGNIDYNSPWIDKMINALASASYFNTQRMVLEYMEKVWCIDPAFSKM